VVKNIHLYLDDSGSRRPDRQPMARSDGMDYFALGGVLIDAEDVDTVISSHRDFMKRWDLNYPLHSTRIRGGRQEFSWMGRDQERSERFKRELSQFLLSLPVIGIACVIHRPGYVNRYASFYGKDTWLMCKTAYSILVERSTKFARSRGATLEIFFEQAGKQEDRDILAYTKALKSTGMPFDQARSEGYGGLGPDDFRSLVLGDPRGRTKKTPMIQLADLFLYPIAKGRYDPDYVPYRELMTANRLIDCFLDEHEIPLCGTKYSCFDGI